MTLQLRVISYILTTLLGFAGGMYLFYQKPVKTEEKSSSVASESATTNDIVHDIQVTEKRPDGTVIARSERVVEKIVNHTTVETKTVERKVTADGSKYSLELRYPVRPLSTYRDFDTLKSYVQRPEVVTGVRLGGTPLWLTAGHDFEDHGWSLGLRVEF